MSTDYLSGKINFHTHTYRCKHAVGTVREMCQAAVEQGITTLGFSEHIPFLSAEMNVRYRRIAPEELDLYRQEIREAQKEFPQLRIFAGMELECQEDYFTGYYPELRERLELDYMIGGTHYIYRPDGEFVPAWIDAAVLDMNDYRRCMEGNVKLMESGLLLYLAHPDLFTKFFPRWTKEIETITRDMFACAEDLQIPLELNANGWRKKDRFYPDGTSRKLYPWLPFWELATEYKIKCVVGSDAHCPADAWGNTSDMVTFAQELGLPVVNRDLAAGLASSL